MVEAPRTVGAVLFVTPMDVMMAGSVPWCNRWEHPHGVTKRLHVRKLDITDSSGYDCILMAFISPAALIDSYTMKPHTIPIVGPVARCNGVSGGMSERALIVPRAGTDATALTSHYLRPRCLMDARFNDVVLTILRAMLPASWRCICIFYESEVLMTLTVLIATIDSTFSAMKIVMIRSCNKMKSNFFVNYLVTYIEKGKTKNFIEDFIINKFNSIK